jgi:hypothetical protein
MPVELQSHHHSPIQSRASILNYSDHPNGTPTSTSGTSGYHSNGHISEWRIFSDAGPLTGIATHLHWAPHHDHHLARPFESAAHNNGISDNTNNVHAPTDFGECLSLPGCNSHSLTDRAQFWPASMLCLPIQCWQTSQRWALGPS